MKNPLIPENETQRLQALDSLTIVQSPAEERFDRITRLARKFFDVPIALVSLVTEKCQWFKAVQGLTVDSTSREISFCGHAILYDDIYIVSDASKNSDFSDNPLVVGEPHIRFYAGKPIKYKGHNIGTLCIIDVIPRKLSTSDIESLCSLAAWVENELKVTALGESQLQLLAELDEANRQSLIDPLTRVWNRKGMDEILAREMSLARREKQEVFIMLLDIDYYKEVNDSYGHLAGDFALTEVAQRIRSSVRGHDMVVRYGGDEFLVYAANCSYDTGMQLARRIHSRIGSEPIENNEYKFSVSVTIGASSATASDELSRDGLIEAADNALYCAKDAGRNCIRYAAVHSGTRKKVSYR